MDTTIKFSRDRQLFINVTGISHIKSREKSFHEINMMLNLISYLVNLIKTDREHDKIYPARDKLP